tara:strand:+ start:2168 stop:2650 length:483 start_codon:yes stop_codon:yes gene_type:complete
MKLIIENWRRFVNENKEEDDKPSSKDIENAINDKLDAEGGAAGLDPLVAAAKKIDPEVTEDEVKEMLDAMSNVAQHKEGDYIDEDGLQEAVSIYLEAKQGILEEKEGKKDACYHKVKARYTRKKDGKKGKWPSAYASGALVKCRNVGAPNWGEGGKKKNK